MKVYKIRDRSTGLFWSDQVLYTRVAVENYLTMKRRYLVLHPGTNILFDYNCGEIVEYELTELRRLPVDEFAKEVEG
jgi:hypothetical protein